MITYQKVFFACSRYALIRIPISITIIFLYDLVAWRNEYRLVSEQLAICQSGGEIYGSVKPVPLPHLKLGLIIQQLIWFQLIQSGTLLVSTWTGWQFDPQLGLPKEPHFVRWGKLISLTLFHSVSIYFAVALILLLILHPDLIHSYGYFSYPALVLTGLDILFSLTIVILLIRVCCQYRSNQRVHYSLPRYASDEEDFFGNDSP